MAAPVLEIRQSESRFDHLKRVIRNHLASGLEAGRALREIRDERLYGLHCTFEEFCAAEFGIGKSHAARLIDYASTVDNLSPKGEELSTYELKERVLRPLASLDAADQRQVWEAVTSVPGAITSKRVQAAVRAFQGIEDEEPQVSKKSDGEVIAKVRFDQLPRSAEALWAHMPIDVLEQFIKELEKGLRVMKRSAEKRKKQPEIL